MTINNVYKMKTEVANRLHAVHDYYFADDMFRSISDDDRCIYITMIGINTETLKFDMMMDKYVVKHTEFNELFEEVPFMTTKQLDDKLKEIMIKEEE